MPVSLAFMRRRLSASIAFATMSLTALAPWPAQAQDAAVQALRREVEAMRRAYESRINELESRLTVAERAAENAQTAASKAAANAEQASEKAEQANQKANEPPQQQESASAFNPGFSMVLNGTYGTSNQDPSTYRLPGFALGGEARPGTRGFSLGETELGISANIDTWLYGAAILAVSPDTNNITAEEAYFKTRSLPWGFQAMAGRFLSGVGYLNQQHPHAWDFADAPLVYRAMFEGNYGEDGVQLRWVAPTKQYIAIGGELGRGRGFPAANATSNGRNAFAGFLKTGADLSTEFSYQGGLSYLQTKAEGRTSNGFTVNNNSNEDRFTGVSRTGIADLVLKWAPDGNTKRTNVKWQSEYFMRSETGDFNDIHYQGVQHGLYTQVVYQFLPRWRTGVRYDWLKASDQNSFRQTTLDNAGHKPERYSGMLEFNTSEFGRFRVQYNHDKSWQQTDRQIYFQYTHTLGAHPAHTY